MRSNRRLIYADQAELLIKNYGKGAIADGIRSLDPVDDIVSLARGVELIPSVDAVPVVRCKDCLRRGTTDCPMLEAFNSYPFHEPEDDAFCSYGVACHTMKTVTQMLYALLLKLRSQDGWRE